MKTRQIVPTGNRVLVKRAEAETESDGGIAIPDEAREAPSEGTIIAVPEGWDQYRQEFTTGDKVVFSRFAGVKIDLSRSEYVLLLQADEIMAKVFETIQEDFDAAV